MWHMHHLWSVQYCKELHPVESGRFWRRQREGEDDGRDLRERTDQVCNLFLLFLLPFFFVIEVFINFPFNHSFNSHTTHISCRHMTVIKLNNTKKPLTKQNGKTVDCSASDVYSLQIHPSYSSSNDNI